MHRLLYEDDHETFRDAVRAFVDQEVRGRLATWAQSRLIDRDIWKIAGQHGFIGLTIPTEWGGGGQLRDYRYRNVLMEEFGALGAASLASTFALQDDVVSPYIASIGTEEQKRRWLPAMASGELIGAIAMTEPGTGSDLRGIRSAAVREAGGWRLSGAKTFITSGIQADLVIVVCRTDTGGGGEQPLSLLVVERGMEGFSRGRKLDKVGLHAQDTAELFFESVFVPDENVLGELGGGLAQLKRHLPLERLSIAAQAVAGTRAAIDWTLAYTKERQAFGKRIADFQSTRFLLAEVSTEYEVTRSFFDDCVRAWNEDRLSAEDAAKAKWWSSELQNRVVDRCLQLFGGYGYMLEYPIAQAFQDARVQKIYGGTNEIMKHIIGRAIVEA